MPSWYTYFDNRFDLVRGTEGWWRMQDPLDPKAFVKRDRTLAVHFRLNMVRSFRRRYKATIPEFLRDVDGLSLAEVARLFKEQPEEGPPVFSRVRRPERLALPEGFLPLSSTDGLGQRARDYVRSRGLDPFFLDTRGVGFCDEGPRLGYLCLPCYEKGRLVHYVLRDFLGTDGRRRYLNLREGEAPKAAGEVLYNSDALDLLDQVYLTEGAFDALTVGPAGVATLGKELTKWQMSMLLRARCQRYVVLGDPGAYRDNLRTFSRLLPDKQVKVVDLTPLGGDVNKVGLRPVLEMAQATDWLTPLDALGL